MELTDAQLKALGLTAAQVKALKTVTPKAEEANVPYLSCWKIMRIKADKSGAFTHTPKSGATRKYRRLTAEEAHALLDENMSAGRIYAVPA